MSLSFFFLTLEKNYKDFDYSLCSALLIIINFILLNTPINIIFIVTIIIIVGLHPSAANACVMFAITTRNKI